MKLDAVLNEALATFEAYRRVGACADDIFFHYDHASGAVQMHLRLGGQTDPRRPSEFVIDCGTVDARLAEEVVHGAWHFKGTWWNTESTPEERDKIMSNSWIMRHSFAFTAKLAEKGVLDHLHRRTRAC